MKLLATSESYLILSLSTLGLVVGHPARSPGRTLLGTGIGNTLGGLRRVNLDLLPVPHLQGLGKLVALAGI